MFISVKNLLTEVMGW